MGKPMGDLCSSGFPPAGLAFVHFFEISWRAISHTSVGATEIAKSATEMAKRATEMAKGATELVTGATEMAKGATEMARGATGMAQNLIKPCETNGK